MADFCTAVTEVAAWLTIGVLSQFVTYYVTNRAEPRGPGKLPFVTYYVTNGKRGRWWDRWTIAYVTADVRALYQHAVRVDAVAITEPTTKPWGQTVAYIRDNSGHLVELCSPLP